MFLELPGGWIVVLNLVAVPAIHLGISWIFTRMDRARFRPDHWVFREVPGEAGGAVYQRIFRIRSWKDRIPDASPWFDGFAKGGLVGKDPDYLRVFIAETCRGEAAHFAQIAALLLTVVWNPWPWAAGAMALYAFASNLPCIVLQRFSRARLRRLLAARGRSGA